MNTVAMLHKLQETEGALVSAGSCTGIEIGLAALDGRYYEGLDGARYVLRPNRWRQTAEGSIDVIAAHDLNLAKEEFAAAHTAFNDRWQTIVRFATPHLTLAGVTD